MVLQNVMHDAAIDLEIVMDQGVSKTDHAEPLLLQISRQIAGRGHQRGDVAIAVDHTKFEIRNEVIPHIGNRFDGQLQKSLGIDLEEASWQAG